MEHSTFTGMSKSPLDSLPPELRNTIYSLVLISEEAPIVVSCEAASTSNAPRRYTYLPGILATCRQARAEATNMFFTLNTFELRIKPRQARDMFQPRQDEARHLWAFLDSLKLARFPIPPKILVRIDRSFSHVGVRQSVSGREIMHQLSETRKFALGQRISNMTCIIETSWGENSISTTIDLANLYASVSQRKQEIELQHPRAHFPKSGIGMATFWHWKTLQFICDASWLGNMSQVWGMR
ncbi:hypothetical protein Slin14017_G119910 [Septoria linicola]|nr:hypothetical protein Slin14017_G119910 [Septoria linicola]